MARGGALPRRRPQRSGGFHNLSLHTTRAHLVRAVLEGVAYNSRWLHEAVERFVRRRLDPIRLIGGGATSDLWCQIHADVMGRTIERVASPLQANLRGAAIFAGLALGEIDEQQVSSLVPIDARFEPRPDAETTYDRLFAEFPRLYRTQKPMFARLNRPLRNTRETPTGDDSGRSPLAETRFSESRSPLTRRPRP